jgi:hypothetical protein
MKAFPALRQGVRKSRRLSRFRQWVVILRNDGRQPHRPQEEALRSGHPNVVEHHLNSQEWIDARVQFPVIGTSGEEVEKMSVIIKGARKILKPRLGKQILVFVTSIGMLFGTLPLSLPASQQAAAPPPAQAPVQTAPQTPEQLQQLVAPIALYADSLVAQILAASTFPEQVVEADRWVQAHPELKGEDLAREADKQPWDPSVKALTAFPSVLGNMDKNISWTSSLGDAYYNQQEQVMDAIQVMRHRAQESGNLKSTPQQTVTTDGPAVEIEPANPEIVYVPAYDPWLVYGDPLYPWPGWYEYPGIWYGGPYLSFGLGFGIGFFGGFGWGWGHWGFDWHNHYPTFNHGHYYSRSNTFYNRNNFYRGGGARGVAGNVERGLSPERGGVGGRGGDFNHPGGASRAFNGNSQAARGYAEPHGQTGTRSGAFSGFGQGGDTRGFSSRGSTSFGGGGFHGGGGFGGGARGGGGFGGGGSHGGGGGHR